MISLSPIDFDFNCWSIWSPNETITKRKRRENELCVWGHLSDCEFMKHKDLMNNEGENVSFSAETRNPNQQTKEKG